MQKKVLRPAIQKADPRQPGGMQGAARPTRRPPGSTTPGRLVAANLIASTGLLRIVPDGGRMHYRAVSTWCGGGRCPGPPRGGHRRTGRQATAGEARRNAGHTRRSFFWSQTSGFRPGHLLVMVRSNRTWSRYGTRTRNKQILNLLLYPVELTVLHRLGICYETQPGRDGRTAGRCVVSTLQRRRRGTCRRQGSWKCSSKADICKSSP